MALLVDSEAQFDKRLTERRVPESLSRALKASGISTLASLSYAFNQPGQTINNDKFSRWVRILDAAATIGSTGALKRLVFESQTQLLALIKEQVDSSGLKRVPQAEREARMASLKSRLAGVVIEAYSEPSHSLLDSACQMHESNQIRYLAPERCTSRTHELTASKDKTKLLTVEQSRIVIQEQQDDSRDLLALDFADTMSFQRHEKFVQLLFSHLNREPPAGYARCTVSQVIAADKAAWSRAIELNVKPRRGTDGRLPLDTALIEALTAYECSFLLMPLPMKQTPKKDKEWKWSKWEKNPGKNQHEQPYHHNKGKGNGKQASQAKGKGKTKWEQRVPKAIRDGGGSAADPSGKPICFDYGLSSCKAGGDGAECPKGRHACAVCFGPHPFKDHYLQRPCRRPVSPTPVVAIPEVISPAPLAKCHLRWGPIPTGSHQPIPFCRGA